jgi:hypothetical protein
MRHQDFERIRNEFVDYYKNEVKGDKEYYTWLKALCLDENLCYGQTHESFKWAKDMIKLVSEDTQNKYYKVLVAFPLKSMNGNVYHEADLIQAALTLKGVHPSVNHKDEFWLSPKNPNNRWGTVTVLGAKYEDGAVEALLQVPKSTLCPVCTNRGTPIYELIDNKQIVNVSLEGSWINANGGFQFNEKGFTLLTSNVLPGIPLARVFPIEAYLPFSQSLNHKKRTIKITGLEKTMKEQKCDCPPGEHEEDGVCVPDKPMEVFDSTAGPTNMMAKDVSATGNTLLNPINPTVITTGTDTKGGSPCSIQVDNTGEKHLLGEAQLKVDKLRAEQKVTAAEQKIQMLEVAKAETEVKLCEAYTLNSRLQGQIQSLTEQVNRCEAQQKQYNSEKVIDATELRSLNRRLEDMTASRDQYKKDFEQLKAEHEATVAKYRETLQTNLALEKKLTDTNEEYLSIARKAEQLEDKVKHVNRITKITTKF